MLRRRLFTVCSALSLLLCVSAGVMLAVGGGEPYSVEFRRTDGLWRLACVQGRFWLDNSPQLRLERERTLRERDRLMQECLDLGQAKARLRKELARLTGAADADGRAAIEVDLARNLELAKVNAKNRASSFYSPETTTAAVARSVPAVAVVGLTALPPVAWAARAARRRLRRRARLAANLCPACGYDLRATPDRCPECGPTLATP